MSETASRLAAWAAGPTIFERYIRERDMARDNRPPEELTPDELKGRIIRNARRVYRECNQCVVDGEYWMRLNPAEGPLDLEWFKVQASRAAQVLRHFGEPLEG